MRANPANRRGAPGEGGGEAGVGHQGLRAHLQQGLCALANHHKVSTAGRVLQVLARHARRAVGQCGEVLQLLETQLCVSARHAAMPCQQPDRHQQQCVGECGLLQQHLADFPMRREQHAGGLPYRQHQAHSRQAPEVHHAFYPVAGVREDLSSCGISLGQSPGQLCGAEVAAKFVASVDPSGQNRSVVLEQGDHGIRAQHQVGIEAGEIVRVDGCHQDSGKPAIGQSDAA